jgi:tRNA G18 (ribose-2'-O)-methylase SpoU
MTLCPTQSQRSQIAGFDAIQQALDAGESLPVLLLRRDPDTPELARQLSDLEKRAREQGARVVRATDNDLRRMSAEAPPADALGLLGPDPDMTLNDLLAQPGLCWLLHQPSYASNVGFAIRTAEVAGADGIVIDAGFTKSDQEQALRVSMGAHRFLPVHWETTAHCMEAARTQGKQIIALEDVGGQAPWELDLSKSSLLVVGNERDGIPREVMDACDAIVRIPMRGFVPSYNLQGALAILTAEQIRQQSEQER